jgi:hypothetical protein
MSVAPMIEGSSLRGIGPTFARAVSPDVLSGTPGIVGRF